MKFFIVIALAAACYADQTAQILKQESEVNPDGFNYFYETSNGIAASANGVLTNPNSENAALVIKGENSYPGDDGRPVKVTYVADENGYQPQGDHLPVPPPTPEAILRSLAYLAAHPQAEEKYPGRAAPPSFPAPAPPRFTAPAPARFPAPSRATNSFGRKPFGKF